MTQRPAPHPDIFSPYDLATAGLTSLDASLKLLEDLLQNSNDDLLLQLRLTLLRATRLLHLCACRPRAEVGAALRLGRDLIVVCNILDAAMPDERAREDRAPRRAQA